MSILSMNPAWLEQLLKWEHYTTEKKHTMMFHSYFSDDCNVTIRQLFYQQPLSTWIIEEDWLLTIRFINRLMQKVTLYNDKQFFSTMPLLNNDLATLFNRINIPAFIALMEDTAGSFPYPYFFTLCEEMTHLPSVEAFNQQCIKNLLDTKIINSQKKKEYLWSILPKKYADLLYQEYVIQFFSLSDNLSLDDEELLLNIIPEIHPKFEQRIVNIVEHKKCSLRCSMIIFEQLKQKIAFSQIPRYSLQDVCGILARQQYRSHRDDFFLNEQLRSLININMDFMTLCFILRFYRPSHIPQLHLFLVELDNLNHPMLNVRDKLIEPINVYVKNHLTLNPQNWCADVRKNVFLPYLNELFHCHLITHLQNYSDDTTHPLNFTFITEEFIYSLQASRFIENKNSTPHQLYTYKNVEKVWVPFIEIDANLNQQEESGIII